MAGAEMRKLYDEQAKERQKAALKKGSQRPVPANLPERGDSRDAVGKGQERSGDQTDPHLKTADRLASEFGVSAPTIKRDAAFAKGVDAIAEAAGPPLLASCRLNS